MFSPSCVEPVESCLVLTKALEATPEYAVRWISTPSRAMSRKAGVDIPADSSTSMALQEKTIQKTLGSAKENGGIICRIRFDQQQIGLLYGFRQT